jgi:hypothetical protein
VFIAENIVKQSEKRNDLNVIRCFHCKRDMLRKPQSCRSKKYENTPPDVYLAITAKAAS